jgi:hypothetical protein
MWKNVVERVRQLSYIPETHHVSRVYNVAAVLYLQFVLHVLVILLRPEYVLYFYVRYYYYYYYYYYWKGANVSKEPVALILFLHMP